MESGEDRAVAPQPIVIHPGYSSPEALPERAQAEEQVDLDDEGLPPPVKAASTPTSPVSGPRERRHSLLLQSGLMALFFAPFGFLMYAFVPDFDTATMTTSILVLMLVGVIFIAVGASNGEAQPRPRPRNLTVHAGGGAASIYDLEALEQNAVGEPNNSGPVQTTTKPKTTSQPGNTIGIKTDDYRMLMILSGFVFLPLLLVGLAAGDPFIAVYCGCCFFPEIWFFGLSGNSKKKEKKGGLGSEISGFWVVLFIALLCLFILASF